MKYTLYWKDGDREVVDGDSIAEAVNKNYGGGALGALDFYERGVCDDYEWDTANKKWYKKVITPYPTP